MVTLAGPKACSNAPVEHYEAQPTAKVVYFTQNWLKEEEEGDKYSGGVKKALYWYFFDLFPLTVGAKCGKRYNLVFEPILRVQIYCCCHHEGINAKVHMQLARFKTRRKHESCF